MKLNHAVGILVAAAFGLGVQLGAAQYGAQPAKPKAKSASTKPAAKGGGSHTMTGCLAKGTEPNTYKLTMVEGNGPKEVELLNAPASLNLDNHIGHKVAITGTGVSARAAARTEGGAKKPTAAEKKEEAGEHHMAPTSVKMIASSCS